MIQYEKLPWKKSQVWLSSDLHGFHKNICRGSSSWEGDNSQNTRDFETPLEMTQELISQINKYVKKDDLFICLGDWTFDGESRIAELRSQIICDHIFLTFGNHDHLVRNKPENQAQFERTADVMYLSVENVKMFLSHYPQYVWHQGHHGVIHCFGHCHSTIEGVTKGKMMDVGVDNAFKLLGEYRPFNLLQVEELMRKKEMYLPDHHQQNTN